jgi:hypothetical protein
MTRKTSVTCILVPSGLSLLLSPLSEKPDNQPPRNEQFSQEMHLNIPLLSRGLKWSNYEPGPRVSALHFFVE